MKKLFLQQIWFCGILFCSIGCINTRIVARYDSDSIVKKDTTVVNWFWGLKQPADIPAKCESGSICSLTSKSNFKTILITAISLGIAVPHKFVWECCPVDHPEEILR